MLDAPFSGTEVEIDKGRYWNGFGEPRLRTRLCILILSGRDHAYSLIFEFLDLHFLTLTCCCRSPH